MNLTEVFASFDHKRIAIIGDVMLDSYIIGKVHRMSPEAPVPVVLKDREDYRLGGAANVALNLKALGAEVFVCSVVGVDDYGQKIQDLFNLSSIHCPELFPVASRQTTVETRVLSGSQHLLRIDQEDTHDLDEETAAILIHAVKNRIDQGLDALIFVFKSAVILSDCSLFCCNFSSFLTAFTLWLYSLLNAPMNHTEKIIRKYDAALINVLYVFTIGILFIKYETNNVIAPVKNNTGHIHSGNLMNNVVICHI